MKTDRTDPLDAMLSDSLHDMLEPQAGRAADRFPLQKPEYNSTAHMPWGGAAFAERPAPGRLWRRAAMITAATAAALAVAVLVIAGRGGSPAGVVAPVKPGDEHITSKDRPAETKDCPAPPAPTTAEESVAVAQVVYWRTVDDGMFVIDDGTPVRRLRRQQWETTTWLDTRTGQRRETYVPTEEVMLVAVPTY
jgi:hypothetical protein